MSSIFRFIHLSDLHYRIGWAEELDEVLDGFLRDIDKKIQKLEDVFLIFSGDLVQSGQEEALYEGFKECFISKIVKKGIAEKNLIFVPGNHDVDQAIIRKKIVTHQGIRNQTLSELDVNTLVENDKEIFGEKFTNYFKFTSENSSYSLTDSKPFGDGFSIDEKVGIYLLNTAVFSWGGAKTDKGEDSTDNGNLHVETRRLSGWIRENDSKIKILVMHHPVSWFSEEFQTRMNSIIASNFDVVLHGHIHSQNISSYFSNNDGSLVLSSPPLFTRRDGNLGYSIIDIHDDKKITIEYRSWSGGKNFVPGVNFTDNETGLIELNSISKLASSYIDPARNLNDDAVGKVIDGHFNDALNCFQGDKAIWVAPDIGKFPESTSQDPEEELIPSPEFASKLSTTILRAPPQFGLSVLGAFFAKSYWHSHKEKVAVFVDSNQMPNYESGVESYINSRPEVVVSGDLSIGLIVVDNFVESDEGKIRQVNSIASKFPNAIIVVLSRCDANVFGENSKIEKLKFTYDVRYVWSLKRPQIRSLVRQFIGNDSNLDEDVAVDFLIAHFDNLNLHRTPHNTITLLTIINSQVDASPVNRTEMIEKFLHIRFSKIQSIPRYSTLPDLKDSLYVIGYFVEQLVKDDEYHFTKEYFLKHARQYCETQYLDIEVDVLFSCLIESNVFSYRNGEYFFHFSYWLYFFIANRMHQEPKFFDIVLKDANYSRYPEVIEYYSGIDRRASGLVEDLASDLASENEAYVTRCELDTSFDPLETLTWNPPKEEIDGALELIQSEVRDSNLPTELKDAIADRDFDRRLPYDQKIREYISESSLYLCMQKMKAAGRALRNSDHADVDARKKLFSEIMAAMKSEMHLLSCLAPVFARTPYLNIEGMGYYLSKEFDRFDDENELAIKVMSVIPYNMARRYLDDIYSPKMAPIFYEFLSTSNSEMEKAILLRFIIDKKPKGWEVATNKYVMNTDRKSFYLYMLGRQVISNYKYGFNNSGDLSKLKDLTGLIFSLHETQIKKPNLKTLAKFANKILGK